MSDRTKLIDVVNLNSDASCLSSERWLEALKGGQSSELYQMLDSYVQLRQKVVLGIVGSTVAEIIELNPECIELINSNPQIFEIVKRPFIHSLSILWSSQTFKRNYKLGEDLLNKTFGSVINWYLPPEFALRNSQVYQIGKSSTGTFIHPKRLKRTQKSKIKSGYAVLNSIQNVQTRCICFTEGFDTYYLEVLQKFEPKKTFDSEIVYGWRDGESSLFLPNSLEREKWFVEKSSEQFERIFLSEFLAENPEPQYEFRSYPQNSLNPWLGDFRLYWYLQEVRTLEKNYDQLSEVKKHLFLNLLNSDILSSTEKDDVVIELLDYADHTKAYSHVIDRKEKSLYAEEILHLLKNIQDEQLSDVLRQQVNKRYAERVQARLNVLKTL